MSLRHAVLGILAYREMHGYELARVFQDGIGLIWPMHHSSLYPNLRRLEEEGLITYRLERDGNRPERKVYSVTREGRAALREWLHEPPDHAAPEIRSAFMLKLMFTRSDTIADALSWIEKELSEVEQREERFARPPPPDRHRPLVVAWLKDVGLDWNSSYAARLRELRAKLSSLEECYGDDPARLNAALRGEEEE